MAYIKDKIEDVSDGDVSSIEVQLPKHTANDLLLLFISQDRGNTAFSINDSSWTKLYENKNAGVRQACYYKIAQSDNESYPTVSGYNAADFAYVCFSIGDIDTSNPIDGSAYQSWNSTNTPSSPSLTLNSDNCLVFYSWDSDGARYIYPDINNLRYAGNARSAGNIIAVGMRHYDTATNIDTYDMLHEVSTEGGTAAVVAVKSGNEGKKEFNIDYFAGMIDLFGYGSNTSFGSLDTIADNFFGIPTTTDYFTGSHSKSTLSPYGYFTYITVDQTPTSDKFIGMVHTFDTTVSFKNAEGEPGLVLFEFYINSTYFKKIGNSGLVFGFADANGIYNAYHIPTDTIKGQHIYHIALDIGNAIPDQTNGTIDLTKIKKFFIGANRNNRTNQALKIYFRRLKVAYYNPSFSGGSENLPITLGRIYENFMGYLFEDLCYYQPGSFTTKIGFDISEGYTDFGKSFISISQNSSVTRLKEKPELYFYINQGSKLISKSLINTPQKLGLTFDINSNNFDLKGTTINNFEIDFNNSYQDMTIDNITFSECDISFSNTSNNTTLKNCFFDESAVHTKSLNLIDNSTIKNSTIYVSDTNCSMTWNNTVEGNNEAVNFTATSGTIDVYRTQTSSPFDYVTAGATINIHNPKIRLKLVGIKENSEVRIYKKDTMEQLAGIENVTSDTFTYEYEYTSDIDVIVTVFNIGYNPIRFETTLSNSDTTIPIQQQVDRTYKNP